MCPETEFNPPSNPLYVYKASTCDPILIQLAHVIHKHTQFKMLENNQMEMIVVHSATINT